MNKPFREQLADWEKKNMKGKSRNKKNKKKVNKREKDDDLSFRDIEWLMGTRRPIYARGKGGAYRQRN